MSTPSNSSGRLSHPRVNRPRPPSTLPPSRAEANEDPSHETYVRIANLQMAKARQKRIRSALQDQIDTCTQEIHRIERKIAELYDEAGIEASASEANHSTLARDEEGFEYKY